MHSVICFGFNVTLLPRNGLEMGKASACVTPAPGKVGSKGGDLRSFMGGKAQLNLGSAAAARGWDC